MPKRIAILKVKFDKITLKEATKKALQYAKDRTKKQHYICTPNPEILLAAQKNPKYLRVLNKSDLNIADGTGILWASKFAKIKKPKDNKTLVFSKWLGSLSAILFNPKYIRTELTERVTGTDLIQSICEKSGKEKLKIFLLGAKEGVAMKVKTILENRHKGIQIVGTYSGSSKQNDEKIIINKITNSKAQILFIAFGAPEQEFWISRNLKRIREVKLAIGVGGAFDYIANIRKRAPKWLQKLGMEWSYRLIQQPSRLKRIYNATVKFPITVLKKNLK